MNRLFARTLVIILRALLILVTRLSALSVFGLRRSIEAMDQTRNSQLAQLASEILHERPTLVNVPANLP